ncbi:MAG: DUF448 domain-containing protein [Helicobacteraceae bacterium]|nr:DUF448 domain-containing protein [Helicobacteraceae bacterium]
MTKIRMCINCRKRFNQNELLRLQIKDETLIMFTNYGRSFYLCNECIKNKDCLKTISKINKINKDKINLTFKEIVHKWLK